jgi:hypothetical protein
MHHIKTSHKPILAGKKSEINGGGSSKKTHKRFIIHTKIG